MVLCLCEVGSLDSLCRWQVQVSVYFFLADTCTSEVHPVFHNPVARLESLEYLIVVLFSLYNYSILKALRSHFLDLNGVILCIFLCVHFQFCKYTFHVCYVFNVIDEFF